MKHTFIKALVVSTGLAIPAAALAKPASPQDAAQDGKDKKKDTKKSDKKSDKKGGDTKKDGDKK